MSDAVREALATIVEGGTLSLDEASLAMGGVMDGEATPAQLAALLMGLRMRGETVDELAGFATAMRERVVRVEAPDGTIDVVGTGGDGSQTFNISTASALVVAAAGVPVAKHGNRAITSRAGSADVLDALGVRIDHDAASAGAALQEHGFAFLFAPNFHPAMRHATPTRREIGVRTAFNLLGPLTNPAGTQRQVLGVGDARAAGRFAEVVHRLGTERTFVIHGDGIDELPLDDSGVLYHVDPDGIQEHPIAASALGLTVTPTARLAGGTPDENATLIEALLRGEPGSRRDVVLLNAGAGLLVAGVVETLEAGIEQAALTIDAGLATDLLGRLRAERRAAEAAAAAAHDVARDGLAMSTAVRKGVVFDIAERRRIDLDAELSGIVPPTDQEMAAWPAARSFVQPFLAPGMHIIGEVKRASPSAGRIVEDGRDPVAQARAYIAGGAAAISVLCEPHWFGGSIDDLRAVRAAVNAPILAKEFVVDQRQLPILRAAGADAVLLLAVLHPRAQLERLVRLARSLGLTPLVEVHDERELEDALATGARLIGINNRDLQTLEVDVQQADRLRAFVPDDRVVIAESGVREPATIARWRAIGFDGALVGEALMRSTDPVATTRSFVAAGRPPDDPANRDRRPLVKICGITDARGVAAAVAVGADAIGLNLVPGTPRELTLDEAARLAGVARSYAAPGRRPEVVAVTADAAPDFLDAITAAIRPDVIQLHGAEPVDALLTTPRPVWRAVHVAPTGGDDGSDGTAVARRWLDAGASRVMLDTAGGPHPGGTGVRADPTSVAAIARDVPVILAGGLTAANVATVLREVPAVGVDVASGVEAPREAGERPRKDPLLVGLFVKRAKAARDDRPNVPFAPTPVHPGLLDADGAGRWGMERDFGGRYVPETLMAALAQLEDAYAALRHDPVFWADLRELLARFAGRPTALYRADRLAGAVRDHAAVLSGAVGSRTTGIPPLALYLKREDLAHTGAHKINNALGQALLTRRLGKTRVIAETGAGQHGVATATACALLDLPCVVYMGAEDIERQGPNVLRMRALGAEVRSVTSGTATLKDAVNEAMRDWVTNVETTHYVLGSAMGPHPYPTIVRDLQRRIGDEAAVQLRDVEGRLPDLALACVGGGSNAIGLLARFIGEPTVRLAVAEAAGDGLDTGRHAAAILGGTPGILHGSRSLMLQDRDGQVVEAHSASAGLDYPGIGPQLAALAEAGRIEVASATDREAVAAMKTTTRTEGILPALETSHAIAALPKILAGVEGLAGGFDVDRELLVLLGFSGRGDKDLAALTRFDDVEPWADPS